MTRDDILFALQHPNVAAFLRVIREGESSQDEDAYTVMFGGSHFDSFADHPRKKNTVGRLTSTAAGAYQFLARTWAEMAAKYGLADFSPPNQDIAAVGLIARRGALTLVMEGRIHEAIARCAREWASLPGSPYGQPTLTLERALAVYHEHGGALAAPPSAVPVPQEVKPMAFPIALIPILAELGKTFIPQLGALFGSGSEVSQRNIAAASLVADTIVKATGAINLQEAAERMQTDPEAVNAAKEAVAELLPSIMEAGGGGIDGARKANLEQPFWRQPAFVFLLLGLPLVYMLAISVLFGVGGVEWTVEVRVMVATGLIALLSAGSAYFWGSSLGSQKKDERLGGLK